MISGGSSQPQPSSDPVNADKTEVSIPYSFSVSQSITKCFTIFGDLFIRCFLEASHTTQLSELLCFKFSANCRDPSVSQ